MFCCQQSISIPFFPPFSRQYEERELKTQQDRAKKKMEFDNQINRVTTQLEYERRREDQLQANVQKFERTVQVMRA